MQFSDLGSLEAHGFARNRLWTFDDNPPPFPADATNKVFTDLILRPTKEDLKLWPHRYISWNFSTLSDLDVHKLFLDRLPHFSSVYCPFPETKTYSIHKYFCCFNSNSFCCFFSFEYRLRITLGPRSDLMLTSRIRNTSTDGKPFTFTFAYHTYFSVSDIR